MHLAPATVEPLRARLRGRVVTRDDGDWDAARQGFNLAVDLQPALVVEPADADDVVEAVRFAAANGLRVAPQATGHNAGPLPALDDVMLLRTTGLTGVELDPAARRARVGAGARWRDVIGPASDGGLAALHGSTPHVTVAGYTLGGGMGWYARAHGLACNRVTAIELVTPDGTPRVVDAERDPELFWALRGGCGGMGVVTALTFELLPIASVHAGALFFPWERAGEVLHAWRRWSDDAPDEVTSCGRILRFPPFPEIPEPLRGRSFAIVEAVSLLDEAATAELLAPLRALQPAMDTFATVPPAEIAELHMDPPEPVPGLGTHRLLDRFDADRVDALLAAAGPESGTSLVSVEVRQTGGALARAGADAGALATVAGGYCSFAVGIAAGPEAAAVADDLKRVDAALDGDDAGRLLNFTEQPCDTATAFDAAAYARLREVKRRVDPDGLIVPNHALA